MLRGVEIYLDGPVKRCTGKGVGVFGVEDNLHDIVGVPFEHLGAGPALHETAQWSILSMGGMLMHGC